MTVGERIRERRIALDMTQDELAKKVGCTYQLISRYENNVVDTIPTKKLKVLADALLCSPYELMEGVKAEPEMTAGQLRLIARIKAMTPEEVDKMEKMFDLLWS